MNAKAHLSERETVKDPLTGELYDDDPLRKTDSSETTLAVLSVLEFPSAVFTYLPNGKTSRVAPLPCSSVFFY